MRNSSDQRRRPDAASRAGQETPRHRPEDEPLGRPRTSRLPKPRAERASQFMPFAALTGFEDYLRATDEERKQMYADEDFAHPEDFSEWD